MAGLKLDKSLGGLGSKKKEKPAVSVIEVKCPECACEYVIPIMKINYVKSFAGNRMQMEWPSKDGAHDYGVVACAACFSVFKVTINGEFEIIGRKIPTTTKK